MTIIITEVRRAPKRVTADSLKLRSASLKSTLKGDVSATFPSTSLQEAEKTAKTSS
jgi:hypothetical protein